jgi:hypothetical protein
MDQPREILVVTGDQALAFHGIIPGGIPIPVVAVGR